MSLTRNLGVAGQFAVTALHMRAHTYLVYAYKDVGHTIPWVLWSCVRGATRSPAENFGTQAAPREGMAQPPRSPSWWPCGLSAVGKTGRE